MSGITTFKIKEENVDIIFSMKALGMVESHFKKYDQIPREGEFWTITQMCYLIYSAYIINCERRNLTVKYSYEDFDDYFEENIRKPNVDFNAEVARVYGVFLESKKVEVSEEEQKKTAVKPINPKTGNSSSKKPTKLG